MQDVRCPSDDSASSHPGAELLTPDGRSLPLVSAKLRVDAGGGLARIVLEQTFENPYDDTLRVTYKMPLPADGAVSGYAFRIGSRTISGKVDRKERARARFEEAIVQGKTAALLEQDKADIFTQEIGNIPPRRTIVAEGTMRDSLRSFASVLDVESVLQEALLRVWQVVPRFVTDGRPNSLLRLGIRIARNLAVSELRRTRSRPVPEEDLERALAMAEHVDVTGGAPDPLLRDVLAKCHSALPEQPRRVMTIRLSFEGGRTDDELASSIGMRLNTFLQNFTRARRMLAECLKRHGVTFEEGLES